MIFERWKGYFQKLMNEEKQIERRTDQHAEVEHDFTQVTRTEIDKRLKKMENVKAVNLPTEVWKSLGRIGVN